MLKHWILLFVTAQTVFSQQCPSGYNLDKRNNRCFKVSPDTQNYVGAMAYCNRDGGLLATIEKLLTPLCETGWMYFNKTDSCYKTFTGSRTNHADAEASCVEDAGGHLTSIHSSEEIYFVSELSGTGMAQDWSNQVIIGHRLLNNAWSWTDGTPFDYQIWAPGAPWPGRNYGYFWADEYTRGEGYRYRFDNYSDGGTTFRAFVCKKPSLP